MQWSTHGAVLLVGLSALTAGCDHREGSPEARPAATGALRIVSLSPAISRTLVDLGLEGQIVGRSAFCRSIDPDVPVVGDLYEVDYERLLRLDPTHVLVQPPSAGLDPHLERLARQQGWVIGHWTIDTIEDIERTIRALPGTLYGGRETDRARAARRAADLLNAVAAALSPGGQPLWKGRTLLVADVDRVLVVGRRTYLDDVLRAIGGVNAVEARGWVELSLEDVLRLDPEAVIIVQDRGPPDDPREAAGALGRLDTTARRAGRIAVLHHPDAHLPSSGVIGVAAEMRTVLRAFAEAGS